MVRIAIVEDSPRDLEQLQGFLRQYEHENGQSFSVKAFSNPLTFLSEYKMEYDLVFLDIELPQLDGISTARRLREKDGEVALVFVTNMEQCAVKGYEVDALDFVVKPIHYYRFSAMMGKVLRYHARHGEKVLMVRSANRLARLRLSQIYYIEIRDHLLMYHTDMGNLEAWGSLSEIEESLAGDGFLRCSSSYLVNLRHIDVVEGGTVLVHGDKLPISQRKRKAFLNSVAEYLSDR